MQPVPIKLSTAVFQRRCWKFKNIQQLQCNLNTFFIRLNFSKVNIGRKVPLPPAVNVGAVESDVPCFIRVLLFFINEMFI